MRRASTSDRAQADERRPLPARGRRVAAGGDRRARGAAPPPAQGPRDWRAERRPPLGGRRILLSEGMQGSNSGIAGSGMQGASAAPEQTMGETAEWRIPDPVADDDLVIHRASDEAETETRRSRTRSRTRAPRRRTPRGSWSTDVELPDIVSDEPKTASPGPSLETEDAAGQADWFASCRRRARMARVREPAPRAPRRAPRARQRRHRTGRLPLPGARRDRLGRRRAELRAQALQLTSPPGPRHPYSGRMRRLALALTLSCAVRCVRRPRRPGGAPGRHERRRRRQRAPRHRSPRRSRSSSARASARGR